jgi:hypothetical protein
VRRTLKLALVGVGLTIALASEGLAATAPNVFAPASIKEDVSFDIIVSNCKSQLGYTATIIEQITLPNGSASPDSGEHVPDDTDGETDIRTSLSPAGLWTFNYTCRQVSSSGNVDSWGPETIVVNVLKAGGTLTAAERKKCSKKPTAAARRKCKAREKAD